MNKLPHSAADLIEELDKMYPALPASQVLSLDREQLLKKAAQRSVVEHLLIKQETEQKARRA